MLTQVPSGWLAQRFGGKRVFGLMMFASSLSTVLVPVAARTHLFLLLTLRFIAGIGSVSDAAVTSAIPLRFDFSIHLCYCFYVLRTFCVLCKTDNTKDYVL